MDPSSASRRTKLKEEPRDTRPGTLFFRLGLGFYLCLSTIQGIQFSTGTAHAGSETKVGVEGYVHTTDPFLVNLADSDRTRYLKARIDIEIIQKKPSEEIEKRLPQIRDAIISVLSSKRFLEIYDSEGKRKLKEEIVSKLNQLLGGTKVRTIYFREFVVQ